MYDLILKGGIVLDGTGRDRFPADIGITRGLIAAVGDLRGRRAERVVDISGRFVMPGFVDLLNHADGYLTLLSRPACDSLIRQGITTMLGGNCGTSLAPLVGSRTLKASRRAASLLGADVQLPSSLAFEHFLGVRKWTETSGVNIDWITVSEFLHSVRRLSLPLHFGTLIGFGTLRRMLLGSNPLATSSPGPERLARELRAALRQGALGLSVGLNFSHEAGAPPEELQALAMVVAEEGKLLSVHLRDERDGLATAVDEVLALAKVSGASLLISHLKAVGPEAVAMYPTVLDRISQAQQDGIDVNMTVYPYSVSYSVLYQYLPAWVHEGGREAMMERLADPTMRARATEELAPASSWIAGLAIARTSRVQAALVGRTLGEIAESQKVSLVEAMLGLLTATEGFAVCFDSSIDATLVDKTLAHPLALAASEGASYGEDDVMKGYLVHPRCFGAFPRFFELVRERGMLAWEEAVQKSCSLPALKLGLHDRGFIARSLRADLVVMEPERVRDCATLAHPFRHPDGIEHVLVSGRFVVENHQMTTQRPGEVIRG